MPAKGSPLWLPGMLNEAPLLRACLHRAAPRRTSPRIYLSCLCNLHVCASRARLPPYPPSQGCTAVHKLKDNLKIFHELAGPVFPPRNLRSAYLVQVGDCL